MGTLEKAAHLHLFLTNYLEDSPNYGITKGSCMNFFTLGKVEVVPTLFFHGFYVIHCGSGHSDRNLESSKHRSIEKDIK